MKPDELKYWLAFNRVPQVGRVRIRLLESHFGTLEQAWKAGLAEFRAAGLDSKTATTVATRKFRIDPDAELDRVAKAGITALTWHDDKYPARLKEIYDVPPVV